MSHFNAFLLSLLQFLSFVITQDNNYRELKFIFVYGATTDDFIYIALNETSKLLEHPNYDNNRPTMLYGFGYTEKYTSKSSQSVVAAYIERGDHNILVVEWSKYSGGSYTLQAIPNSYGVGKIVGKTLVSMKDIGFNLTSFHLVGHSLGGHLVGFIGRNVYRYSEETFKITRITSLDPAGPLFYGIGAELTYKLNKDDAKFVDVIHTDSNFFGASDSTGTADFWPNEGKDQPGCPPANWDIYNEDNFCSHRRSWAFYSESVQSKDQPTFNCLSCQSWMNFTENLCETSDENFYMGIDADPKMKGNYYLQTNSQSPFNQGVKGIIYEA